MLQLQQDNQLRQTHYFAVQALLPIGIQEIATLAGAVYGLMPRVIPTSVRDWFTSLRVQSAAFSIEAFTIAWCSPQLFADEFSHIQAAEILDESLSIKAHWSPRELTSIYKKRRLEWMLLFDYLLLTLCELLMLNAHRNWV